MIFLQLFLLVILTIPSAYESECISLNQNVYDLEKALQDIVNSNHVLVMDTREQEKTFLNAVNNLIPCVEINGPIPAMILIINYWMDDFLQFVQKRFDHAQTLYTSIFESIIEELQQLTKVPKSDVIEFVNFYNSNFAVDLSDALIGSTQRINETFHNARAFAAELHYQAMSGCDVDLVELQGRLRENFNNTLRQIDIEWTESHKKFTEFTWRDLNNVWRWCRARIIDVMAI